MRHHRIETTRRPVGVILLFAFALTFCRLASVHAMNGSCSFGLSVKPEDLSTIETEFELEFMSETWSVALKSTFEGNDWDELKFETDGAIGYYTLDSELVFEPDKNRWKHWQTEVDWPMGSLTLEVTAKLSRTTDWLTFETAQESEVADVDTRLRLRAPKGSRRFAFYDADFEVAFTWCGIDSEIALAFDDDGFDELTLEGSDAAFTALPGVFFDVEIVIDLDDWEIEVDPVFSVAIESCLKIEIEAQLPGFPSLGEVRETEIVASWECEPWEIEATIRLDPDDWIDDLYWLEVEADLEIDLPPCGELAATIVLNWTQAALGRMEVESTWSPTEKTAFGAAATRDLDTGRLEEVALNMEFEW